MAHLPQDIVEEHILPRLPVKSLLQFRCVSKQWLSAISHPRFAKLQLQQAEAEAASNNNFVIKSVMEFHAFGWPAKFQYHYINLNTSDDDPEAVVELTRIYSPPFPKRDKLCIDHQREIFIGSCNGLLCMMAGEAGFIVWNPVTKEHRLLPPPLHGTRYDYWMDGLYGFGYDSSTDDYKILLGDSYGTKKIEMQVFSLRSNSWHAICCDDEELIHYLNRRGVLVNGAFHWKRLLDSEIVAFELEEEKFKEILLPHSPREIPQSCLSVLDGRLSVAYDFRTHYEMWVLEEYVDSTSWTKLVSIPRVPSYDGLEFYYEAFGILKGLRAVENSSSSSLKNGEVLILRGKRDMVRYNLETEKCRKILVEEDLIGLEVLFPYVESLISPNNL